jgi:hypothetical protein
VVKITTKPRADVSKYFGVLQNEFFVKKKYEKLFEIKQKKFAITA